MAGTVEARVEDMMRGRAVRIKIESTRTLESQCINLFHIPVDAVRNRSVIRFEVTFAGANEMK